MSHVVAHVTAVFCLNPSQPLHELKHYTVYHADIYYWRNA
jgi:hypothetical protein